MKRKSLKSVFNFKYVMNILTITFGVLCFSLIPCKNWYKYIGYNQTMKKSNPIEYTLVSIGEDKDDLARFGVRSGRGTRSFITNGCFVNILYKSDVYKVSINYDYCRNIEGNSSNLPKLYFLQSENKIFSEFEPRVHKINAIWQSCIILLFIIIPVLSSFRSKHKNR